MDEIQHDGGLPSPVLITGAGGFIGSHLAEACVARGLQVRAMVRYRSTGDAGWLDASPARDRIEIVQGDVRDMDSVRAAIAGCRSVLHLAALIGIPYSYRTPLAYIRTNVEGTYNILEAARWEGCERVAVTSTSETYGTARTETIDESHAPAAQSPYAASKVAADQLALSYHRSFGLPVTIMRPFNTYGPRQSARAFIPTVIAQLLGGRPTLRLGNLAPTRDLTFVADTVEGMLAAAGCEALIGRAVNIGAGEEIAMGDLARRIARLMGFEIEITADPERQRVDASEVHRLRCNASLLREATGWRPRYSLDDGLIATIDWMRHHRDRFDPDRYQV